jgi:hypothetical protein
MFDRSRRTLLSIAAISVAITGRASAQSAEAESLFAEGERLIAANRIVEACDAFEASNRIEPRAGTLIRLGACREANHQIASAWSAYKDAVARARDPRKHEIASAKVAELEPQISYLTVLVSDESRIDGLVITRNGRPLDPMLWNRAAPVDGGDYVIAARAPGHEAWQTSVTLAATGAKLSVEVPKFKELAKLVAPLPPPKEVARATELAPAAVARGWTTRRRVAIGVASASGAALIAGTGLAIVAKSRLATARALCPDPSSCDAADRANALAHSAHGLAIDSDVAFGVAAAAVATAGVLWLSGKPRDRRVAVMPTPSGGLVLYGRF